MVAPQKINLFHSPDLLARRATLGRVSSPKQGALCGAQDAFGGKPCFNTRVSLRSKTSPTISCQVSRYPNSDNTANRKFVIVKGKSGWQC